VQRSFQPLRRPRAAASTRKHRQIAAGPQPTSEHCPRTTANATAAAPGSASSGSSPAQGTRRRAQAQVRGASGREAARPPQDLGSCRRFHPRAFPNQIRTRLTKQPHLWLPNRSLAASMTSGYHCWRDPFGFVFDVLLDTKFPQSFREQRSNPRDSAIRDSSQPAKCDAARTDSNQHRSCTAQRRSTEYAHGCDRSTDAIRRGAKVLDRTIHAARQPASKRLRKFSPICDIDPESEEASRQRLQIESAATENT
jgi:hypothetical protein